MKKFFIAALMAVSIAGSAFAADANKVSYSVVNTFKASFKNASDVQWSITENFTKASFVLNNQHKAAFYTPDGEWIANTEEINIDQIPEEARNVLENKYAGYTVKEVIRFEGVAEEAYYISVENEQRTLILKVNESGEISIFKCVKK